ncbi:DUF3593 domain-containing protein [Synechococcus sp. RSCCF101]|uniref:DUF3593 domain-containing protein n=1 Tax=Synechococcus sp. RSCCF101 TaxID=2511069 RepID=UPI00124907F5|nr:DUF3593 domain-containing protein [Synechococcus sp. RSCCF101]QEY31683.1 DUF3593 domain-containing protein [Synechococcus sp. RSCCF101]
MSLPDPADLLRIDPAPLFALSLLPYLLFLRWAARSGRMPPLALLGFRLTLLFVAVTIAASIWAELGFGASLVQVDALHGGAEAFLTLSNLMVVTGFALALKAAADGTDAGTGDAGGVNKS